MIDIRAITPGESYACKFRVETMLDTEGKPADSTSGTLQGPGAYESWGFLKQRDSEKQLVIVVDVPTGREFVVPFEDLWDVDTVEVARE